TRITGSHKLKTDVSFPKYVTRQRESPMEDRIKRNGEIGKMTHPKTNWQLWWKQMRPHTLTASFTPVLIGTALALPFGDIHVPLFLAMLLAALIIQAATNL